MVPSRSCYATGCCANKGGGRSLNVPTTSGCLHPDLSVCRHLRWIVSVLQPNLNILVTHLSVTGAESLPRCYPRSAEPASRPPDHRGTVWTSSRPGRCHQNVNEARLGYGLTDESVARGR